jgi:hypothetical protein
MKLQEEMDKPKHPPQKFELFDKGPPKQQHVVAPIIKAELAGSLVDESQSPTRKGKKKKKKKMRSS